jgi:predicted HNH restriction endonuclease
LRLYITIEIHHQKPVFQFDGDDLERTIEEALENVIPVCSNCHRMIHRIRDNPLTLNELKEYINKDLDFCSED